MTLPDRPTTRGVVRQPATPRVEREYRPDRPRAARALVLLLTGRVAAARAVAETEEVNDEGNRTRHDDAGAATPATVDEIDPRPPQPKGLIS